MKKTAKLISLLLMGAMLISLCACAAPEAPAAAPEAPVAETEATAENSADTLVLKVGGLQTTEDPSTKALYKMAEIVEELSGGTILMQIYPASQLGAATAELEATAMGSQDMFVDANWMGTFMVEKTIDTMWFTFDGAEHYAAYINSDLNKADQDTFCEQQNLRIIASNWYRAPRSFCSKKPLNGVADFEGLVIRVPDLTGYVQSVDALGGKPTQVAWAETYLALQQGVVDAAEGPIDNLYSMNFYEAAPYITVTNHLRDSMQVMINDDLWNSLSAEQQQILTQAAEEAGDWYTAQIEEVVANAVATMKENGATVTEMSPEALAEMKGKLVERINALDADATYWPTGTYEQIAALSNGK